MHRLEHSLNVQCCIIIVLQERDVRYVDMIGPMSDDKSFIDVPCESREVVRIECNHLECGRRPAHIKPESIARR